MARHEVRLTLAAIIERRGAGIAFPTRTLHIPNEVRLANESHGLTDGRSGQDEGRMGRAGRNGTRERAKPRRSAERAKEGYTAALKGVQMMRIAALLTVGIVLGLGIDRAPVHAQGRTVFDGVYSEAQAARGEAAYAAHCSSCHMPSLRGFFDGGMAASIIGEGFVNNWTAGTLLDLFAKIKDTMPYEAADTVSDADKLDIMTYVLKRNAFPAGDADLALDEGALSDVLVAPKGGLPPPASGQMVRALGCLSLGPNGTFVLTRSTAPKRIKNPLASRGAALKAAATEPLADANVQLLDVFPKPTNHVGHRVEAKGLLITEPSLGINVIAFTMVAENCGS
ncbi:MAG: cytochrome c [Acidimicrobiia bacterium]|nr:cytochrome c [Acidimicrobiia bacterium]